MYNTNKINKLCREKGEQDKRGNVLGAKRDKKSLKNIIHCFIHVALIEVIHAPVSHLPL